MVNQITDPPNNYNFGLDFNYAVWTPGTSVSLVNVPWNNDYRDIVRFSNKSALDSYIDDLEPNGVRIEQLSYIKPNQPVRINKPINTVVNYNYLRASNPLQPIPGNDVAKNYYYFINDVRYLSPNTTELVLQLDVWQTFGYDVTFGNAFVERGHIGIANENQFDSFGREYLTVPEGFDLGNEYRVITKKSQDIIGSTFSGAVETKQYDTLVISTVDLLADYGTETDPKLKTADGSTVNGIDSGAKFYVWEGGVKFSTWLSSMRDYPWITQGIISITVIPKISRYLAGFIYSTDNMPVAIGNFSPKPKLTSFFPNWRSSSEILNVIPERYRHLKKFFTYPYMGVEVTTWSATPVSLKPEAWQDDNAPLMERLVIAPPTQRVQVIPRKYNSNGREPLGYGDRPNSEYVTLVDSIENDIMGGTWNPDLASGLSKEEFLALWTYKGDDFGDYLDVMTQITNFPQGILVNNGGIAYLAANANTIDYQRQSADWSQNKSLAAARTSYDQAGSVMQMADALTETNIAADRGLTGNTNRTQVAQTVVSSIGGIASGGAAGSIGGLPGAAVGAGMAALTAGTNLVNAGIQVNANDEALAIRTLAANQSLNAQQNNRGFIRDTNRQLADWAARGDYANEIAGINARVQDAQLIQPTISGQYGGDAANHSYATAEISVRWKLIDNATVKRVGDFWLRYGYAINMFIDNLPTDMMVMQKFTYWKMTQSYLLSSPMPEAMKQTIRGIFEKGVTVWRNPSDIGTVDIADNQALGGISY